MPEPLTEVAFPQTVRLTVKLHACLSTDKAPPLHGCGLSTSVRITIKCENYLGVGGSLGQDTTARPTSLDLFIVVCPSFAK